MDLLIALIVVLMLLWFGGISMGIGGNLLHLLLLLVLVLGVVRLLQGQK